jgi:hypothetical protein
MQACMDAWAACNKLVNEKGALLPYSFLKALEQCAHLCISNYEALKENDERIPPTASACIELCDDCADLSAPIEGVAFQHCANACSQCSLLISSWVADRNSNV